MSSVKRNMNVEFGIWNVELVGFADYIIMNYSMFNYFFLLTTNCSDILECGTGGK